MNEGLTAMLAQTHDRITCATDFTLAAPASSMPRTLDGPNSQQWQKALDYEIGQLEKLGTWVVEDLPEGQTAIPCTKVLREKRDPSGDIESFQVRIVAGRHKQIEGMNYMETFSVAAKLPSVHVVLANATMLDWEIHQIDVKSTYLNAPLKETVYMRIPRDAAKPEHKGKVCRLLKGLYGLNQAGRGWHQELT